MYGMRNMATYGATKAFDIVLAEALWTELHDKGVDVLALVLAATDTPAFRTHLAERGLVVPDDEPIPLATVTSSEDTAAEAIAYLADGPTRFVGEAHRTRETELRQMERNDAIRDLVAALDAAQSEHS
jgi:short-subunit dehydrogenase